MEYRKQVIDYLASIGISGGRIEQRGEDKSIVVHIDKSENRIIEAKKEQIEKDLDSVVVLSQLGGFNVVIVESNDVDDF